MITVALVARRSVLAGMLLLAGCATSSEAPPTQPVVRQHSDASGEKLPTAHTLAPQPGPSDDQYLTATGYGELTKGQLICQRVSDTAARAELAKLIRVTIKEHAIDRVRERTGKPLKQDIEVVREELVNELLQDAKIVDRKVDKAAGTCSSTAVMRRSNLIPLSAPSPPQGER